MAPQGAIVTFLFVIFSQILNASLHFGSNKNKEASQNILKSLGI